MGFDPLTFSSKQSILPIELPAFAPFFFLEDIYAVRLNRNEICIFL